MIRLVENFREFLDLAKISQGPDNWSVYGANPKKKKTKSRRPSRRLTKKVEDQSKNIPN
jgi:hypothetical protein